jgi:hypothetical protein
LVLYRDCGWYDFEADHGGHGAFSFLVHEFAGDTAKARRFASEWLSRAGHGTFDPAGIDVEAAQARAKLYARRAREAIEQMLPAEAWSSDAPPVSAFNLRDRGLPGPYPRNLLGHLDNARIGECALVALLTGVDGTTIGVQLGYLVPGGAKSELIPRRAIFYLTVDPEQRKSALFRIPPSRPRTEAEKDILEDVTLLAEGVEGALAVHMAFPFVPVIGLPGIGRMRHIPPVAGIALIVRDGDEPGSKADQSLNRGVDHLILSGSAAVRVTATPLGQDADKIVLAEGIGALRQLIPAAPAAALSPDGQAARLAAIPDVLTYERERTKTAKILGVRRAALDVAVLEAKKRAAAGEDIPPDKVMALGPEPWPAPVDDIAAVMDAASVALGKHVIASPAICNATALWCLFTHFIHHTCIELPIAPRLAINAVSPECGKTTLLTLARCLVCRPLPAASLTPAVVYRTLDKFKPTLVLDEVDTQLRSNRNPELNAVLRASHNRHFAQIPRNVRSADDNWDVELFSCWGAYVYTTIGRIDDDALESRAIKATLLRATPAELKALEPLDDGTSPVLVDCGRKFARWAGDQAALPDVAIPDSILARDRDNWRPLFRLAAQIGGEWPQRAREAAIAINGTTRAIGDVVPLLNDIREAFGTRAEMTTRELVDALRALPEPSRDWSVAYRGREINEYYFRDRLKGLVDAPANERKWRVGQRVVRGYRLTHFQDAFARYLPDVASDATDALSDEEQIFSSSTPIHPSVFSDTSATSLNSQEKSPEPLSATRSPPSVSGSPPPVPVDATDMPVPDHGTAGTDPNLSSDPPEEASYINAVPDAGSDVSDATGGNDIGENKNLAEPPSREDDTKTWLPTGDPDAPQSSEGPCTPI